jgi:phosphohistidine phosphatase
MELYLVRHAKAEAGSDDFSRALTKGGRRAAERMAGALHAVGVSVERIEHSPLVRAAETAAPMAAHLGARMVESNDLRPDRSVEDVRERLLREPAVSLMLVGHNPFMEQLASLLLAEDLDRPILTFHTASTAKLISIPGALGGRFTCDWLITPAMTESKH